MDRHFFLKYLLVMESINFIGYKQQEKKRINSAWLFLI